MKTLQTHNTLQRNALLQHVSTLSAVSCFIFYWQKCEILANGNRSFIGEVVILF